MYYQPAIITTSQHFIQAFSWMLLHSLWQGLLLAVLGGFLLILTKKSASTVRYNLLLANLLLFVTACIFTFAWEWNKSPALGFVRAIPGLAHARIPFSELSAKGLQQFAHNGIYWFSANSPLIVLVWLLLFIVRSVRLMSSLVYVHRARHRFIYQPPEYWTDKVDLLCRKLQLSRVVQLLESGYVKMPMVIGHLKPIILVPMGLIAGLPAGQMEAILLHELAHVRRHDYVVNVLQTIAETIFCFNPGLLWLSSVLRDERENCCDDIALAQTKNKKEFVQALISFKEHALYGTKYQVAFPGKKNHLFNRVSRIIGNKNPALGLSEKASFIAGLLILFTMLATAAITGSRHARITHHRLPAVVAQPVALDHRQADTKVNISVRQVRFTLPSKPENTDAIPASKTDSLQLAVAERSADRVQAVAAIGRKAPAVAARQDRKARTDDPAAEKLQADRDQEQAQKDEAQAVVDQAQGRRDQIQALKDHQDALKDQEQARRDQEQARLNQLQVEKNEEQDAHNREQDRVNEVQSKKNQEQAARNKEQERLNEVQAKKNREQAVRNEEQMRLNRIQESKNEEQAHLNEIQAKKNEEAAQKNNVSVQK